MHPHSIAIDSEGNVYVTDMANYNVQKFDSEGNFLSKWGEEGTGDGQFKAPEGLAIDSSDNVYAADTENANIQKFDSEGNLLTDWFFWYFFLWGYYGLTTSWGSRNKSTISCNSWFWRCRYWVTFWRGGKNSTINRCLLLFALVEIHTHVQCFQLFRDTHCIYNLDNYRHMVEHS